HGAAYARVEGFEAEVDRLAALIRARGEKVHLAGYSLGGRVAIGLLCRHAGLFRSATLSSAQPGLHSEAEREERRAADERWCAVLESRGIEAFVEAWEKLPLFATQSDEMRRAQRRERLSHDPRGLAHSLRTCGLGHMPSYSESLALVPVPTSIV